MNPGLRTKHRTCKELKMNSYWDSLPNSGKIAARALGYDENKWDNAIVPDEIRDKFYDELSDEQKDAAFILGYYDKESWDT